MLIKHEFSVEFFVDNWGFYSELSRMTKCA